MLVTTNITNSDMDVARYRDADDLRRFCDEFGLDGLELLPVAGSRELFTIPPERVVGVHLPFYTSWYDFWRGDEAALMAEYGSPENVRMVFGGERPECALDMLNDALDLARALHARYVVFHVSNVTVDECLWDRCVHRDEDVCAAAAEMIDRLDVRPEDGFDFLLENLWWPGLTLTRPEVTRALMEAVRLPRKGIMLDTGHLMNCNPAIRSQADGIDWILEMIRRHGSLSRSVRGLHFHQSVSGAYVRSHTGSLPAGWSGDYFQDFPACYTHIQRIDRHRPWTNPDCVRIIDTIEPSFLTHELAGSGGRTQLSALRRQLKTIQRGRI